MMQECSANGMEDFNMNGFKAYPIKCDSLCQLSGKEVEDSSRLESIIPLCIIRLSNILRPDMKIRKFIFYPNLRRGMYKYVN